VQVGTLPLDRVAFRYSDYDTPFWASSNTAPGRWHVPDDGPTQYLCLHPDAAWADLIRTQELRTAEDLDLVRMPIWAVRLRVGNLADYSTFEDAASAGFPPAALVDDDHARAQVEGRRLRDAGFSGVIAPSAALPGSLNVTLFGARVLSGWNDEPMLAAFLPACVVARGGPQVGLLDRVRYRGQSHAGLEGLVNGGGAPTGEVTPSTDLSRWVGPGQLTLEPTDEESRER
jgi:hypothetical protein